MAATDSETTALLIQNGATVNYTDSLGNNALTKAITRHDARTVEILLKAGADANHTLPDGTTVLNQAIRQKDTEISHLLTAHGAKIPWKKSVPSLLPASANTQNLQLPPREK